MVANGRQKKNLITVVVGTRPEVVKLAPVVRALQAASAVRLVLTGQHEELVEDLVAQLGLSPDARLGVMVPARA